MPDQNPFANAFTTPDASASSAGASSSASSNPFSNAFSTETTSTSSQTSAPSNPFASAFGSQDNGQTQPTQHLYQDPSQPWYKRAFDFAQTPTIDFTHLMSKEGAVGKAFGRTSDQGGFERGAENLVSGFTAPLSLALTAATFGGSGLIESAGATALKESGEFAAEEIPQILKASQAAVKAAKDLEPGSTAVEDAVRATGIDPARFKTAQDVLWKNRLTENDLAGGNALENGAFHIIRSVVKETPVATAAKMAKTATAVMNAGFTYQQLESAAAMSPRFLDALKEGDYDAAKEYGVEALAGGALGLAGAGHAIKSWGELTEPILSTKLRPSDTTVAVQRAHGTKEAEDAVAETTARNLHTSIDDVLGHEPAGAILGDSKEVAKQKLLDHMSVYHQVVTGGDTNKAAAWHNVWAEADGRDQRLGGKLSDMQTPKGAGDNSTQPTQTPAGVPSYEELLSQRANTARNLMAPEIRSDEQFLRNAGIQVPKTLKEQRSLVDEIVRGRYQQAVDVYRNLPDKIDGFRAIQVPNGIEDIKPNSLGRYWSDAESGAQPYHTNVKGGKTVILKATIDKSDLDPAHTIMARMRAATGHDESEINLRDGSKPTNISYKFLGDTDWKPLNESSSAQGGAGSPDNGQIDPNTGLPANIADIIARNKFKNMSPEYKDAVLESMRRVAAGELSDRELAAAKLVRDEHSKTLEIGQQTGLIKNGIDNYMKGIYKDENPDGRVIRSDAKTGRFATNVSSARQKVYDSHATAMLLSPKEFDFNVGHNVAQARLELLKAAANKKWIETIMDNGFKDSTGRPVAFLKGSGNVVSGPNGEAVMVKPGMVRKINIADSDVAKMRESGDLERFLDDGTIEDVTPYVHPDNINGAIARLEEQAQRKDAQYDEVGNNKLRTDLMYLKSMANNQDFSGLKDFNEQQPKIYKWNPQGYIALANDAVKGWNFVTNSPDGTPVYVHSDVLVSPEYAQYMKNRLGLEPSGVANNPVGKALLGIGTKAKETLLSLSPFHLVQEALRGLLVGINPFHTSAPDILTGAKVDPLDPNSPTKQYVGVQNGLNLGVNYKAEQAFSEGVSSAGGFLKKIPVAGKPLANSMNWFQDFLFRKYIPGLAARGYELMFDRYKEAHSDWSVDKVARAAASHTNDTFGMLDYRKFGRSAAVQDVARLVSLAPAWLESEVRSGARLFNNEGGLGRAQVAKMSLALWGIARVLNMVTTGNPQLQAPFGLAVKNKEGKETIFSIRTLPTDLLHAASDPVGFLKGRLSPVVRTGQELLSQRDQFGRKMQPADLWADVGHQLAPIPLQAVGQALEGTGPQIGNIGQGVKALGGTATVYQTPAQKFAAEAAANHNEDGPIDPAQMARHRRIMQFEDAVRSGEMSWPDLMKLTYQTDQLSESELKKIETNMKATKGLDPGMASLYTRASRLPAKEYLDLYDTMNSSEKSALTRLTIQVQKRYLNKAKKDETPEDRAKDPVFQRFLTMIPQRAPTQEQ